MNINLCVISWSDQTTNHCFEEFLENNWQLSSISWDFLKMIEIFYSWSLLNFRWLRYSKMSSAWSLLIISTFRSKSRLSFEKIEKIVLFWLIIRLALISEISKRQQRVWKVIHNLWCCIKSRLTASSRVGTFLDSDRVGLKSWTREFESGCNAELDNPTRKPHLTRKDIR